MPFDSEQRLRQLALGVALLAVTVAGAMAHLRYRQSLERGHGEVARACVAWLGVPDLALSSSSRWLRHPSQAEPAAAAADLPAALDVDPAGAVIGPPRAVLAAGARDARRAPSEEPGS